MTAPERAALAALLNPDADAEERDRAVALLLLPIASKAGKKYGRNSSEARDLEQEALSEIFLRLPTFKEEDFLHKARKAASWGIFRALAFERNSLGVSTWGRRKIKKARRTLVAELGRDPTPAEVSNASGIALAFVETYLSGPAPLFEESAAAVPDEEADEGKGDRTGEVQELLDSPALTPGQRGVIVHRFGLEGGGELTLREIAAATGTTPQAVSQLLNRALNRLRTAEAA